MVSVLTSSASNVVWSVNSVTNATNYATINGNYQTARLVSGGMRVKAMTPLTGTPAILFAGNIYDSLANIENATPNTTNSESQLLAVRGASQFVEVDFRPSDLLDYALQPGSVAFGGISANTPFVHSIVSATIAQTTTFVVEAIYHGEGNSGVDLAGIDTEPSIADELPSIESTARMASGLIGPETNELTESSPADMLVSAMQTHQRTMRRAPRSLSLRSEGGYVGVGSSDVPARGYFSSS